MTDINCWSTILPALRIKAEYNCERESPTPDVINWKTTKWKTENGVELKEDDISHGHPGGN